MRDGYVHIYEYRKDLLHSTHKRACAAQETTTGQIKRNVGVIKF